MVRPQIAFEPVNVSDFDTILNNTDCMHLFRVEKDMAENYEDRLEYAISAYERGMDLIDTELYRVNQQYFGTQVLPHCKTFASTCLPFINIFKVYLSIYLSILNKYINATLNDNLH